VSALIPPVMSLIVGVLFIAEANALDPNRTLSQALLRKWQVQQGLPQATILSIRQTSDHYLWLGTPSGLFRFDGVRFLTISDVGGISLENLWVQDLCEDAQGNLWIATDGAGLIRLADTTATRFGLAEGLPSDNVRRLLADPKGDVWAATENGLARISNGDVIVYRQAQGLSTDDVWSICQARDGRIWVGGESGRLDTWTGTEFTPRPLGSLVEGAAIRALSGTSDGTIWIGTTAGLVRLNEGKERRFTTADGLADNSIECLAEGADGSLWVGTKDGVGRVRQDEIESFRPRDGLSQSTVYTLCEDHEGSLWVGTKHGLNQFVDRRTTPFTASEGLPSNDTGPVFQDGGGTIWVGTLDAGLARFDGRHFSVAADTESGLTGNAVRALAEGDPGELWIGTEEGLCRMRDGQIVEKFTVEQGLPSNSIGCLCRDAHNVLWAGTTAGLAELRDGRFVRPQGDPEALRLPIVALVEHGSRLLLAATAGGGLYRVVDGQFAAWTTDDSPIRDADAFFQDSDGLLWIGTRGGGLRLIDGERTFRINVKDGLYDDEIFGIVADDEDRLWMACSRGMFFVMRGELRKFAASEIKRFESTPFSPTDAQRTVECQAAVQPAVWKMRDGRIWFSTIRGLLVIDPRHMQRRLPKPAVVVEEVKVNGQPEEPRRLKSLPPGRTNLDFRYTALSFASPTRIAFRYRLEGFDKDWVDAGSRREAFYTNLPPGSYQFRVAARYLDGPTGIGADALLADDTFTLDGTSTEVATPVAFTLQPHFYQRRWFLPLVAGLAALAAWIAYRLRLRRIRAEWCAVLAERGRIARELHDTLMQGFSGVTMQMQALAARLPASPERRTLEEVVADAGLCLREARRSVAGLRSAGGGESGLASAIAEAARQITETQDIRLHLQLAHGPVGLATDVEYDLLRIAQEALANAVKHSAASEIDVELECTPRQIRLSIHDDGVGFNVEGQPSLPGHYGLIGMRERASRVGAELRIQSEPGSGTTVELSLPTTPAAVPSNGAGHNPPGQNPAVEWSK